MSAFIPQLDPDRTTRERDLANVRSHYLYNHTYLSPLAMVENLPCWEEPSWQWMVTVGETALRVLINHADNDGDIRRRDETHAKHGLFREFVDRASGEVRGLMNIVRESIGLAVIEGPPHTLESYASMFRSIGLPPIHRDFHQDRVFAEMRVGGPNPVVLRRVDRPVDHFPVTQEHFARAIPGNDSLEAAGREGRLYLLDYKMLEGIENSDYPDMQKYVYAPLCLLVLHKSRKVLMPVAIQCQQTPGPDNPIFTPDDGPSWMIAKTVVKVADGNHHEAVTHLGRTHLFVEPFVIATRRQLAPNHPLYILLVPHFEGTLSINNMAKGYLVGDRGPVDELLGGTIDSTRRLTVRGVQEYPFDRVMLPDTFRARGGRDPHLLPNYPYRDDALLYWGSVHRWVTSYLDLYYRSDADVQADPELAAWFAELVSADGGRVVGIGKSGPTCTREYLANAATLIIFTASVQHAAVNFPQYDLMSYVPNMPLACYAPAPTSKHATHADYLAMLPPLNHANLQMGLGALLGTVHYSALGQYCEDHFEDPRVAELLRRFNDEIRAIGDIIEDRNRERRPYEFLVPSGIPQSINI
jgi:arachidonate 15-lipoxygenase